MSPQAIAALVGAVIVLMIIAGGVAVRRVSKRHDDADVTGPPCFPEDSHRYKDRYRQMP